MKRLQALFHALLVALLIMAAWRHYRPIPEQVKDYKSWSQDRVDLNAPSNAVVFIGDSHIAGMFTDNIATPSVNLGIGGDTTRGLLERIGKYQCIKTARAVVIEIGVNDLQWRSDGEICSNLVAAISKVPKRVPVTICAALPVNESRLKWAPVTNKRITGLNTALAVATYGRQINFIYAMDRLDPRWDIGDGVHLNREGYKVVEYAIREAIEFKTASNTVGFRYPAHWDPTNRPDQFFQPGTNQYEFYRMELIHSTNDSQ